MTSISAKFASSSTAIPQPATDGDKSIKQVNAKLTEAPGEHPAMPGLHSRKAKPTSGISEDRVLRHDIGPLPKAADSLDALAPREPAGPSLSRMPREIIERIGEMANPTDVFALGITSKKNHAVLRLHIRNAEVDAAIQNIQNPDQYNKAKSMIGAIDPLFRAARVDALTRKSNRSGTIPVSTFSDLAEILKGAPPQSRGNAIRTMSELIRTLATPQGHPLVGDQKEAHATLLAMAKEMSPELRREVLRALRNSPAPEESNAKAQKALSELG